MDLKVINCPDKHFKPYVEDAVRFFGSQLIPNTRIRNNCLIRVRFDAKIINFGSCGAEGSSSGSWDSCCPIGRICGRGTDRMGTAEAVCSVWRGLADSDGTSRVHS